jgi:hypothetical protein
LYALPLTLYVVLLTLNALPLTLYVDHIQSQKHHIQR